jgi:hypothetical protein
VTDDTADKSAPKPRKKGQPRGKPFEAGKPSANPKGRPRGLKNRVTVVAEALIEGQSEAIIAKIVELGLKGDTTMLRWLGDRLVPPRKDKAVNFALPVISSASDALLASQLIVAGAANGAITPDEAQSLCKLILDHTRLVEVTELEGRLAEFERERGIATTVPAQ